MCSRQLSGVKTGKPTKNAIWNPRSSRWLIAKWVNWRADSTVQLMYRITG